MLANLKLMQLKSEQNQRFDEIEKQLNQLKGLTEDQKEIIKSQKQELDSLKTKSEEQLKLIDSQKADINVLKTSVIKLQLKLFERPEFDICVNKSSNEQGSFHVTQKLFAELKQRLESETTQRLNLEKRLKTIEKLFDFNNEMNSESNQSENNFNIIEEKVNELMNKMESKITKHKIREDNTLEIKLDFIENSINDFQKEFKKISAENERLKTINCDQGQFYTIISDIKNKMDSELNQRLDFESLLEEKVWDLSQNYLKMSSDITKLNTNVVPIGFTYIQFFSQPSPNTLWPNLKWEDITHSFAGLFFRAEGKESLPFGEIQEQQNQTLDIYSHQFIPGYEKYKSWHRVTQTENEVTLLVGGYGSSSLTFNGIKVRFNNEEIRPRNQSIRIWTRIK